MDFIKKIKRFKLLTPTPSFADWIVQSGPMPASVLNARLLYSWLAYRSRKNLGSSARAISKEVGLHPTTVAKAVISLIGLIERRDEEWIALPPPDGLFITWKPEGEGEHWSDGFAYLTLLLPRKGAVIKYPATHRKFGLNHALIFSHLVGRANKKGGDGVVRKFTMAGAAKLFGIDPKTVGSIMDDLLWVGLIHRVDLGRSSDITVTRFLTDVQLAMFEPKTEPIRVIVEPREKLPRSVTAPYEYRGDDWDECRRLCDGHMPQKMAENAIAKARRLSMTTEDFGAEFHKLHGIHETNILKGKVATGNFGKYLVTSFDKRVAILDEQERKEQMRQTLEADYLSPESQQRRAEEEKSAAANPLHPKFSMSIEAIRDRVHLDESPVIAVQKLGKIKDRLDGLVRPFIKAKNLNSQDEVDEIGNLKGRILKHALAALNSYYKQPVLATQEQFEWAINEAITKIEPSLKPLFTKQSKSKEVANA